MEYVLFYKCFSDPTRLRILNLLQQGALCVCHIHEALGEPQAKISKQLAYMKKHGLLISTRRQNWSVYEITPHPPPVITDNLNLLNQSLFQGQPFQNDLKKLAKLDTSIAVCAQPSNHPQP